MKRLGLVTLTALLMSIQLLSTACHKIGGPIGGGRHIAYVNDKDNSQMIELEAAPQPLRQWWHGEPKEPSQEGEFVRNDGKQRTVGQFWSDANVYVVKGPKDGVLQEARFSIQPDLSLRDESGVIWRRTDVNGPA